MRVGGARAVAARAVCAHRMTGGRRPAFSGDVEHIIGFGTQSGAKDWIETKPPNNSVTIWAKQSISTSTA
jgi:hypothetical protein